MFYLKFRSQVYDLKIIVILLPFNVVIVNIYVLN